MRPDRITVGLRPGHSAYAKRAGGSTDIFNDDRLYE
jgi:hypothetical protein